MMAAMQDPTAHAAVMAQLDELQSALRNLAQSTLSAGAFSALVERQSVLLAALPARYAEVLNGLVTRLESSALFTEESCSFSHRELLDSLQMWVDKARGVLVARPAA